MIESVYWCKCYLCGTTSPSAQYSVAARRVAANAGWTTHLTPYGSSLPRSPKNIREDFCPTCSRAFVLLRGIKPSFARYLSGDGDLRPAFMKRGLISDLTLTDDGKLARRLIAREQYAIRRRGSSR